MKYTFWSLLLCSRVVFANPIGETSIQGSVTFDRPNEKELHVSQKTDRAIIEWEKFSIDAGELTKFLQPGPESVLLNKVVGGEMSAIYGKLEANGQIILMNPHGVLVGKTGVIDACAFLATAQEISYADFMEGKLDFSANDLRGVINVEGRIDATRVDRIGGRIFLVADEVSVDGELLSQGGEVELGGRVVSLLDSGVIDVSATQDAGSVKIDSNEKTNFYGTIFAKSEEGNGGIVEVSGKRGMVFEGKVSTSAPNGESGKLILDPVDVEIVTGGGAACTDVDQFADPGALVQIDPATLTACGTVVIQATQDITITDALTLNISESFTAQAGRNIAVNQAINTDGGNITLQAGPFSGAPSPISTGSITFGANGVMNTAFGGNTGGAITVQAWDISSTASGEHTTNTGNVSFFAENDMPLIRGNPTVISTDTGVVTMYANRHINFLPGGISCNSAFSGTQIDIRADFDLDGVGDLTYQGVSGNSNAWFTTGGDIFVGANNFNMLGANPGNVANGAIQIQTTMGGNVEIQVRGTMRLQAGTGVGNSAAAVVSDGDMLIRAGTDIIMQGGTGGISLVGVSAAPNGAATLIAGRDIQLLGGASGTLVRATIDGTPVSCQAGRDIIHRSGGGTISTAQTTSNGVTTQMKAGRHIIFEMGSSGDAAGIEDNGSGCDVRAGGDIIWANSFEFVDGPQSIYIEADAPLLPVYTAQTGPYLTGTPLATPLYVPADGRGAFQVDTAPVGGGITFRTITVGSITLYSAAQDSNGVITDIIFDSNAVNNALSLSSFVSGDISVAGFHNTEINNTISTAGAILIATDNTMNINVPGGFVTAGGPITLIVDEQTPFTNGGGFFNNFNNGVSTSDPDQRIAIYAASGPLPPAGFSFPNQVNLGNLSAVETWDVNKPLGLLSKYGTSYQGGGTYHGAGFGTNYVAGDGVFSSPVIWYKVIQSIVGLTYDTLDALQQLRTVMPERLWVQEFSILIDRKGFRDQIKALMNRAKRESSIQSRFALAYSKDYLIRSTMSGENIRIMDRYQEFLHSPFWRTPEMLKTLYWLEDRK